MCQNVIKNTIARLPSKKKADFNIRLGAVRIVKRQRLWVAQDSKCHYCNRQTVLPSPRAGGSISGLTATLDHIITQSNGGTDSLANLVVACYTCNSNRLDMDYEVFRTIMATPNGWENHIKKLKANQNAKREEIREANKQRTIEVNLIAKAAAGARQNERNRKHAQYVIQGALKNSFRLPDDEEERIQWAIRYHLMRTKVGVEAGPDGINLLRSWINQANFAPRKNGKGDVAND